MARIEGRLPGWKGDGLAVLVPLYGFVPGDTLGVLVLVRSDDTIAALAASLAQAVSVRVLARGDLGIRSKGTHLDPRLTVARAGLTALDRVDLICEGSGA